MPQSNPCTKGILGGLFPALVIALLALGQAAAQAQITPPAIFYSDLEGGPSAGGENNAGAYVTIYGRNFGASQGSSGVSIGGSPAARYPIWSDTKLTFQIATGTSSGSIILTTVAGASNAIPFSIRPGTIYFVSRNGSDGADGTFASPWASLLKVRNTIKPGDVAYALDGVSQLADDGTGWSAAFTLGGNDCGTGSPRALIAYPGATVTIGTVNSPPVGIRASNPSERGGSCPGGWVFAGLTLRAHDEALGLEGPSSGWRVVGNDMSCPNGDGQTACVETSMASNIKFYGNNVHDTGTALASSEYHGVYFSTDSNHVDMGWNTVANVRGCRGVHIHSSPLQGGGASDPTGHNQFDIVIHDNLIHDTQCDGIILATVDPSQGKVEVYNNIIYNAGKGPYIPGQGGNWTCVYVPGTTNVGPQGGGVVEVYNNTMYNCGSIATPPYDSSVGAVMNGGGNANLQMRIRNNILNVPAGRPYIQVYKNVSRNQSNPCSDTVACDGVIGSNNVFFGAGVGPSNTNITASISADPLFANAGGVNDFHLRSGSPARGAGVNAGLVTDFDGLSRAGSNDIGALQGTGSGTTALSFLTATPTTLSFTSTANGTQAAGKSVTLNNTGSANAAYSATGNQTWLSIVPASGTVTAGGSQTIVISASNSGLAVGTYNGVVTVTGGSNGAVTVAVTFVVTAPTSASYGVTPAALTFASTLGGAPPATQTVTIANAGSNAGAFTASSNQPWLTVTPTSGNIAGFSTQALSVSASMIGLTAGSYAGIITVSGGGNGAQTATVQFTVSPSTASAPVIQGVLNAASYQEPPLSPGEIISIFGLNLGPAAGVAASITAGSTVPTTLSGVQVIINLVPAPLLYVQGGQINAIVPRSVQGAETTQVQVVYNGVSSPQTSVFISTASAGVFTIDYSGKGQAVVLNANGVVNSLSTPAARGSVVSIYTAGLGVTNPAFTDGQVMTANAPVATQPTVSIGGVSAVINYAGLIAGSIAGVYRIDVVVPAAAAAGSVPLIVASGTTQSAAVSMAVQ